MTDNPVIEEAKTGIADDEEIKRILGLIIAEVFVLDATADSERRPKFAVQHIPYAAEVVQELTQFKVQLYLSVVERTNALTALRENKQFVEYVSALDDMWTEFETETDTDIRNERLSELRDELVFHEKKFANLLRQLSVIAKGIELIETDCGKHFNEFADLFAADELRRSVRSAADHFAQIADRLSQRIDSLSQTTSE